MGWTRFQITLAVTMVITGSINTLATKWVDLLSSENSVGKVQPFNHPFVQSVTMFMGELLCLIVFDAIVHYKKRKDQDMTGWETKSNFSLLLMYPPALLDMTATSIMNIGLYMTYAGSYQMLRGAVIIFTGILSTLLLKRKLSAFAWVGMFVILGGLAVVGVCDFIYSDLGTDNSTETVTTVLPLLMESESTYTLSGIITGDILIICAQVISAFQFVYEEKYFTKHNIPAALCVGWEGIYGFFTMSVLLIPFYYIPVPADFSGNPRSMLEDALDAFVQIGHNGTIFFGLLMSVFSIAVFNFAGVSVTKEMSATTRMVLDSVRTLVIWACSLGLFGDSFYWLQVAGFVLLILGMFIYNGIIPLPYCPPESANAKSVKSTADDKSGTDNVALELALELTSTEENGLP